MSIFRLICGGLLFLSLSSVSAAADNPYDLFLDAMQRIRERYVDEKKADPEKLVGSAVEGVIDRLDSESFILPPENQNGGGGVGLRIGVNSAGALILDVAEGSPAEKAGLNQGDRLLRVDGRSAFGRKRPEIESWLEGRPGSGVRLMWLSQEGEYWEKTVRRAEIRRVSWRRVVLEEADVIQVFKLDAAAAREIGDALKVASREGRPGAVLDLRRANGGQIEAALNLAGQCFAGGELLAVGRGNNAKTAREYVCPMNPSPLECALVLLIGPYTQGPAELLAASLRDHLRAVLVGERTFGFVARQEEFDMAGGRRLRLSVERFQSPSLVSLSVTGVGADLGSELVARTGMADIYRRRRIPELLADRLIEDSPAVFDSKELAGGTLKLAEDLAADKSMSEQQSTFEEAFALLEESILREQDIDMERFELARQRAEVISRVRVILAERLMDAKQARAAILKEDPVLMLGLDALKTMRFLKPGKS